MQVCTSQRDASHRAALQNGRVDILKEWRCTGGAAQNQQGDERERDHSDNDAEQRCSMSHICIWKHWGLTESRSLIMLTYRHPFIDTEEERHTSEADALRHRVKTQQVE